MWQERQMLMEMRVRHIALAACCFFASAKAHALGVSPATTFMEGVAPGELIDTKQDLIITNDADVDLNVVIETMKPMMPGHESLKGFRILPDPSFVYADKKKMTIPPKSTGRTRVFVNVPNEEKYYNQHWAVSIRVRTVNFEFVRMAVAPFFIMETLPKADIKEAPEGSFGLVPTLLEVKRAEARSKKTAFTLYNNTEQEHKYSVKSYISDMIGTGYRLYETTWYNWVKDLRWVRPAQEEVTVGAGQKKEVELFFDVPDSQPEIEDRKGWEALVNVEDENKERRFIRVRINQ